MFSSIVATVYEILPSNKFYHKKLNLTSISFYNKPIIVLFVFLPLEAVFHNFSLLLLVTSNPIARFRSNFLQTVCSYKAYPPKAFLSFQIVVAVHH